MKLMTEKEFGVLGKEYSESRWCTAGDPLTNKLYAGLDDHRKLVIELSHRLHKIDALLRQASCPGSNDCATGECAFCYDRKLELEALTTFYREYAL